MKRRAAIVARLTHVVQLLGELADEFVFVGGSVVPLLVTDEGAPDARLTVDVDAIVETLTRSEYQEVEQRLARVGFHLDVTDAVICRYKYGDLILDVMPTDEDVLKFGNRWYKAAARDPIQFSLLANHTIKIINAPLFLCTKFDAFGSRGQKLNQYGMPEERDLEDIIALVDGRYQLIDEISRTEPAVRAYISQSVSALLQTNLPSRLDWFLPTDKAGAARQSEVLRRLRKMSSL